MMQLQSRPNVMVDSAVDLPVDFAIEALIDIAVVMNNSDVDHYTEIAYILEAAGFRGGNNLIRPWIEL